MALLFCSGRSFGRISRQFHFSPAILTTNARRTPLTLNSLEVRQSVQEGRDRPGQDEKLLNQYRKVIPREAFSSAIQGGFLKGDLNEMVEMATRLVCTMIVYNKRLVPMEALKALSADTAVLSHIALVLRSTQTMGQTGSLILKRLADSGEPLAVIGRASEMLDKPRAAQDKRILDHLTSLATRYEDPQSMVLYSLYLQKDAPDFKGARGQKALGLVKKAYELSKPVSPGTSVVKIHLSETLPPPWLAYADVMTALGEDEAAFQALEVGVAEYDSPRAYERLADQMLREMGTKEVDLFKYEEYLLKSAMAHNPESCYRLGNLYLTTHFKCDESDGTRFTPGSFERRYPPDSRINYNSAISWYDLATATEHPRAALVVAACLRHDGESLENAEQYLVMADTDGELDEKVQELRNRWTDEEWDFEVTSFIS